MDMVCANHNPKKITSLPKDAMMKIIKEKLPPNVWITKGVQVLLGECCIEFINMLSSESNEISKGIITPTHVLKALQTLGFEEYVSEVQATYNQHKIEIMDIRERKKRKRLTKGGEGIIQEEAIATQQRLFAEARIRMNNGRAIELAIQANDNEEEEAINDD